MDENEVCHVNEQGELICSKEEVAADGGLDAEIRAALAGVRTIPPKKLDLMVKLVREVLGSTLDDSCIEIRTSDTAKSVHYLLQQPPPVVLLYRYVALPGNILATYYEKKGDFIALNRAVEIWSDLKPGC